MIECLSHRTDIISDLQEQIAELMAIIEQMNRDQQSALKLVSDPCISHTLMANTFRLPKCQVTWQADRSRLRLPHFAVEHYKTFSTTVISVDCVESNRGHRDEDCDDG